MKELKILAIVVGITAVTYFGIEPYAHQEMHPHVSEADFTYSDLPKFEGKGDARNGENLVLGCTGCHSITAIGMGSVEVPMPNQTGLGGVVPPDLSHAGELYNPRFLANFLMNPNHAAFESTFKIAKEAKLHEALEEESDPAKQAALKKASEDSVAAYNAKPKMAMAQQAFSEQDALDIVARLQEIAASAEQVSVEDAAKLAKMREAIAQTQAKGETTDAMEKELAERETFMKERQVYTNACGRCHTVEYDKETVPALEGVEKAKYALKMAERAENLTQYLGSLPPDLSQMIRSRGEEYLINFISDPQKYLTGTAMPRVGLTQEASEKVVSYLESIGDSKKEERSALGLYVLGFMVIFSILAYLFKRDIWRDLH